MNELQKKQSLCEKLNMNLDEANELFAEETLQSMQMALVNICGRQFAKELESWQIY